jgi:hypothetical protein
LGPLEGEAVVDAEEMSDALMFCFSAADKET